MTTTISCCYTIITSRQNGIIPIYKHEYSSGGCFLTSACTAVRGLPDDCRELTILRNFQDNWLKHQPDDATLIAHHYEVAPKIVGAINKRDDRLEIRDGVYREMVMPCVEMIEVGRYNEALGIYRRITEELEGRYCG